MNQVMNQNALNYTRAPNFYGDGLQHSWVMVPGLCTTYIQGSFCNLATLNASDLALVVTAGQGYGLLSYGGYSLVYKRSYVVW